MAIDDDFTIDFINKNILVNQTNNPFVNGLPTSIYSMNELYSYLQDLFDEPANMDIEVPMSAQTPTEYTMINGWFIDDQTIKTLFGGALSTDATWTRVESSVVGIVQVHYSGGTDPVASDIGLPVTHTDGDDGVLLNYDTDRQVLWIRPDTSAMGDSFDNTSGTIAVTGGTGSVTQDAAGLTGLSTWGNIFSLGTVETDTELYVVQVNDFAEVASPTLTKISRWWSEDTDFTDPNGFGGAGVGQIDLLIKVREVSSLIDRGFLTVFARQFDKLYSHFSATVTQGRTPIPLGTADDLNNDTGYRNNAATSTSGTLTVGEVVTGATSGAEGVVTSISGSNPNQTFQYYLIGVDNGTTGALVDFTGAEALSAPGGYAATSGTLTNVNAAADTDITITFGHNETFDVDQNDTVENYGIVIDVNSNTLLEMYERTKFLTRRGEINDIDSGSQTIIGESYLAIGGIFSLYDAEGTMGPPTEGEAVTGSMSGATGIVTEVDDNGTSGYVIIRQVRGTFVDNDVVSADAQPARSVTLFGAPSTVAQVPTAPFGTFAGGVFFGARGVVIDNVLAGEATSYQLIDSQGNQVLPPNTVGVSVIGLVAGDRAAVFRVDTPGGVDITKNEYSIDSGGTAVSAQTILVDGSIATDVPGKSAGGYLRVVDVTDFSEYRYKYASWTGSTFTLYDHADYTGTTDSPGDSITLNDSTTAFLTNGEVEIGLEIRNVTDGSIATIVTVANGQLITTPLSGGGDNTWQSGDSYEINQVVVALVDADQLYVPLIDHVATGTSVSNTLVYVSDIDVVSRVRQSTNDPKILPFTSTGGTVTSSGLTVSAIRTSDSIAT